MSGRYDRSQKSMRIPSPNTAKIFAGSALDNSAAGRRPTCPQCGALIERIEAKPLLERLTFAWRTDYTNPQRKQGRLAPDPCLRCGLVWDYRRHDRRNPIV